MPFNRPETLWNTVASIGAGGRCIRVDDICIETDVWRFAVWTIAHIKRHCLVPGIAGDGEGMTAVSAGIAQNAHLIGCDCAITFYTRLHANAHRVTCSCSIEFLGAGKFKTHRSACSNRQMRSHILDQDFLFPAKTAANARLNHPYPFRRQVKYRRNLTAHVEGNLRARTDHEAIILIPVSYNNMRLDMRRTYFRNFIGGFKNMIRFGKTFVYIADVNVDLSGEVSAGIRVSEINIIRLVMDLHRTFSLSLC